MSLSCETDDTPVNREEFRKMKENLSAVMTIAEQARNKASASEKECAELRVKVEELLRYKQQQQQQQRQQQERISSLQSQGVMKYSRVWRSFTLIGAFSSPATSLYGLFVKDLKWTYRAYLFWAFSLLCSLGFILGDPKSVKKSWKEKFLIVACCFANGSMLVSGGMATI